MSDLMLWLLDYHADLQRNRGDSHPASKQDIPLVVAWLREQGEEVPARANLTSPETIEKAREQFIIRTEYEFDDTDEAREMLGRLFDEAVAALRSVEEGET